MPSQQRVTGQHVADRAGVSRATVSYVLNDVADQPISADTRARVLAAATELGYTPHAAARQLRTGNNDLILMALPPWQASHALSLSIATVTRRLAELGYIALVDPATDQVSHLEHTLSRVQPIALVASAAHLSEPLVTRLRASGTRLVLGFGDRPLGFAPVVTFDQRPLGRVAMTHLADGGHRSVVAVMPSDPTLEWFRSGRQKGAEEVGRERGMAFQVVETPLDQDHVGQMIADVIAGPSRPDAVLAYNDDYALLTIRALIDAGVRVPDDIAVIGCDNLPLAELIIPRLTSVHVDMDALGTRVAETMHEMLSTGEGPDVIPAPTPVVVVRDSA